MKTLQRSVAARNVRAEQFDGKYTAVALPPFWNEETAMIRRLCLFLCRAGFALAAVCTGFPVPGACAGQNKSEEARPADAAKPSADIKQFCANNAAMAGDARIAWQTSKLLDLEAQINQRLAELEDRKAQIIEWLRKRDEAMQKASESVVAIFSHMKPAAAAAHLSAMDESLASAVLAKLPPRAASAILNEMEPARAAQLTRGMVLPDGKRS